MFQSTLPVKGVTRVSELSNDVLWFQSTLPVKGVTLGLLDPWSFYWFQSTLPVKGVTLLAIYWVPANAVSIHTPSEGSDDPQSRTPLRTRGFNPHSQ